MRTITGIDDEQTLARWFFMHVWGDPTLGVTPGQLRAWRRILQANVFSSRGTPLYDAVVERREMLGDLLSVTLREVKVEADGFRTTVSHGSWYIGPRGGVIAYDAMGTRLTGQAAVWCWLGSSEC